MFFMVFNRIRVINSLEILSRSYTRMLMKFVSETSHIIITSCFKPFKLNNVFRWKFIRSKRRENVAVFFSHSIKSFTRNPNISHSHSIFLYAVIGFRIFARSFFSLSLLYYLLIYVHTYIDDLNTIFFFVRIKT